MSNLILSLLVSLSCLIACTPTVGSELKTNSKENQIAYNLLEGNWVADEDSLASISIRKKEWIFQYDKVPTDSNNHFHVQIVNALPEYVKDIKGLQFIILTHQADTFEYEILGLNEEVLSLMYYPAGKRTLYLRQKK